MRRFTANSRNRHRKEVYKMLTTSEGIDKFTEDLITSARERYKEHRAEFGEANIEFVESCLNKLGAVAKEMKDEGIDIGHLAMSMDYFSRGVSQVVRLAEALKSGNIAGNA